MIDAWSRETDAAKRKAMIDDINRQAYQTVPYVILGQYQQPVAVRANLTGVLKTGGTTAFWNMVKK
jgi:peptide/nickel transport system substrate-binding protein